MPIKFRREYLNTIRERYKNALKKRHKGEILNEFCSICGYDRKYAIRILNNQVEPRLYRPGPKPIYNHQVVHHLKILWEAMHRMCAKNMVVAIPLWMPFYKDVCQRKKTEPSAPLPPKHFFLFKAALRLLRLFLKMANL